MRGLSLALTLLLGLLNPLRAQEISEPPETLKAAISQYEKALATKNHAALEAILADGFHLTTASGKTLGKAEMLGNLKKNDTHYESFQTSQVRFHKLGTTILETGQVRTKGTRAGKPIDETTLYTDIWVYHNNRWLLLGEHSSYLKP